MGRPMVSADRNRGRGAQTNASGRFERLSREGFDDGWSENDPLPVFETVEHSERARSAITRNESPDIGFDRSINPYRGCEHGCTYCFARPSHAYLGLSAGIDFERDIFVKSNVAEVLKRELAQPRYKPQPIAIGTNTDPYQPAERQHKLMRDILSVLLEARHPVTITTKSALVARDLDLLVELAALGLVNVGISVTSMDHKLSRSMEPRASTPARRLEAMRLLSEAGVPTMVMAAPMIPAINDAELERILDAAAAQGARAASMIVLRLPGEVRNIFREWLLRHHPGKLRHVLSLVRDMRGGRDNDPRYGSRMRGDGPYAIMLRQRFEKACERYGLARRLPPLRTDLFEQPRREDRQLSLF
ncbi:MAG TPA: PA0069 family radical SAM protein [Devosiaceae bacterium]